MNNHVAIISVIGKIMDEPAIKSMGVPGAKFDILNIKVIRNHTFGLKPNSEDLKSDTYYVDYIGKDSNDLKATLKKDDLIFVHGELFLNTSSTGKSFPIIRAKHVNSLGNNGNQIERLLTSEEERDFEF